MEQIKKDKRSVVRDLRMITPLSQAEQDAIDDWRFDHRMPSRAEAVREMLRRQIEQEIKK